MKKSSYARQSVVYMVENKCFPPSGDGSYGKNLFLGEEGHFELRSPYAFFVILPNLSSRLLSSFFIVSTVICVVS